MDMIVQIRLKLLAFLIINLLLPTMTSHVRKIKPVFRNMMGSYGDRIVAGKTVNIEKYPYYVQFIVGTNTCGGTIVSEFWIMSAAHCVYNINQKKWIDAKNIYVYTGAPMRYRTGKNKKQHVVRFYKYLKEYTGKVADGYDVILAMLHEPIHYDKYRQPLRVCGPGEKPDSPTQIIAVGLGLVSSSPKKKPMQLQEVRLKEIDDEACRDKYAGKHPPKGSILCHNNANDNSDTCQGDSGGPLAIVGEKGDFKGVPKCLYGVVSYGATTKVCGDKTFPTVAAKPAFYYDRLLVRSDYIYNSKIYANGTKSKSKNPTGTRNEDQASSNNGAVLLRANSMPLNFIPTILCLMGFQ